MKRVAGFAIAALFCVCALVAYTQRNTWPKPFGAKFSESGSKHAEQYKIKRINATERMQRYSEIGDYLNYGTTKSFSISARLKRDEHGIPMAKARDRFVYDPVMVAQYALTMYGKYLQGEPVDGFLRAARKLLEIQRPDGSLPTSIPFRHYTSKSAYPDGWTSAMAQGQAMSVYERAYKVTSNRKFLRAGNRAFSFMDLPKNQGGTRTSMADLDPSLDEYLFYLEYRTNPDVYSLNGYMFSLIGLYDWWKGIGSIKARNRFHQGVRTLAKILPYYDLGNFSAYDLSYITVKASKLKPHASPGYHAVHLSELQALASISPNKTVRHYLHQWASYVNVLPINIQ